MTEASVSSAFMTALRKRLPGAVVIKHRDASFIGLPDCSVTYNGRTYWLEFKLWQPPKKWDGTSCPVISIAEKSPVQYKMMQRLNFAAVAFYVVWAKKSGKAFTWCAHEGNPPIMHEASELAAWFEDALSVWLN
jgi:hypothetical protein